VGEYYGVTNWDWYGLVLFNLITYVFYGMIRNCVMDGQTPHTTLDIFGMNLATQFLLCFTRYAWYIYLVVPGYIGFKLLGYVWGYIARTNDKSAIDEQPKIDPKEAKRLEKKQRKEEKPRVKYIK